MTKIDRNWKVIEEKKASGVDFPEWFLRVLGNRGIAQKSQLEDYLNPKYENIADFENFTDIKKASTRIKDAKEKNETICVYGDYDVDGITATALVYESLSKIGIQNIKTYIPHRENEGYGLNKEAVSELKKEGVNLIITVDCGIVSSDIIDTEKEIDFIVIDHHKIDKEKLPKRSINLHPSLTKDKKEYNLSGCGMGFYFARALQAEFKEVYLPGQEKWLLDLVALATICDIVYLLSLKTDSRRRVWSFRQSIFKKSE